MPKRRLRVGVVFGGRSVEHDVSLVSAKAIMEALEARRYDVVPIAITRTGRFDASGGRLLLKTDPALRDLFRIASGGSSPKHRSRPLDVVFPIVHGAGGEDGALQGLLTLADLPFVGAGVLGSALGMDKAVMKSMFHEAGLPMVRHRVATRVGFDAGPSALAARMEKEIGCPCFVKPANGGSSVGITKAKSRRELEAALRLAFRYDRKVIIEQAVEAREIECSVLGNDRPEASVPGEIVPSGEFYDYAAKYLDTGSRLIIPAELTATQQSLVRELSVRAFQVLDLAGMARVDFFVDRRSGAVFLNEVNTLPGFTPISMYPKMWEASGVPFPTLVDRLVRLALQRHAQRRALVTSFTPRRPAKRRGA